MPTLGSHLNFTQLEARNMRIANLSAAPSGPVTGQVYYDTVANSLFFYNGTSWISASGGTASDATATTKGVIQLAGDLGGGGTAAAPVIANLAITAAKIATGTITDVQVAGANKDGAVGTASLRTLGTGAQQAMPGNKTLDTITAPAGAVNMNGQKITNMQDPTASGDAATKNYVDTTAQGLVAKPPVRAIATGNITQSGTQTIDGIAVVAGDRVLCAGQTTAANNGIWVVAAGAWARATDMNTWAEVPSAYTWVEVGTANADTGWVCTSDPGGTLGTTAITFVQFTGAAMITAGAGLQKSGNTISALVDGTTIDTGGAGSSLRVIPTAFPKYYNNNATHALGTTISITQATHGCRASRALIVQVQDNATGNIEFPDVSVDASGNVTITYANSLAANSKMVTIIG